MSNLETMHSESLQNMREQNPQRTSLIGRISHLVVSAVDSATRVQAVGAARKQLPKDPEGLNLGT